jgi:hypothetical protein
MALGRAFIEVHADLRAFKKRLSSQVTALIKETQAAVDKAVREAMDDAGAKTKGKTKVSAPTIKPKVDTNDAERDTRGFFRSFAAQARKGVAEWASSFASVVSSGGFYNAITAGLVTAAVAASPLMASVIAAAITTGIGLAGIGAGIALAFRDTRIKSAAKQLGNEMLDELTRAAEVFVAPVQKSIGILRTAFAGLILRIERGFQAVAPYVDDLAYGIQGFIGAIGPGLEAAFRNAGPMIQIVADYLPVVGEALGSMLEQISASEGARAGLVAFFQVLADGITFATDVITTLTDAWAGLILLMDKIPSSIMPDSWEADIDEMINAMNSTAQPAESMRTKILSIGGAAGGAASKTRDLTTSLDEFFGAQLAHMDAQIAFEQSIDNVAAAFKGANDNININTERGRQNVQTVNEAIKAAIRNRDAVIQQTGSVTEGNAAYKTQIDRLREVLRQSGLTKTQIDKLIGAYDDIPPEVNTDVNAPGLSAALQQAARLNAELDRLQSRASRNPMGAGGNYAGVGGYAEGDVVRRQQLAWVAEGNRPEAIVPLTNPTRAAKVMAKAGLLGMGGGTVTVQLILDGKIIDERVVNINQGTARRLQQQPRVI